MIWSIASSASADAIADGDALSLGESGGFDDHRLIADADEFLGRRRHR